MVLSGAFRSVTYGLDAAIRKLEMWGLLRGRAACLSNSPQPTGMYPTMRTSSGAVRQNETAR